MTALSLQRLQAAYDKVRADLMRERTPAGHWTGELAASALSTATAVSALALASQARRTSLDVFQPAPGEAQEKDSVDSVSADVLFRGMDWLARRQNKDGGWGDTDRSDSNIATTLLVEAAFRIADPTSVKAPMMARAQAYLKSQGGIPGLRKRYGKDKTFSVPILTNAALAGMVDWKEVSPLPFELAMLPMRMLGALQLPVVSYALPALIAIGQARHHHAPSWNPFLRAARAASVDHTLTVLTRIQPGSGGFLEATPLTSFVVMSLVGTGRKRHPVVQRGVKFLLDSRRPDGAWPIDTNLATWVTTLALNALASGGEAVHEDPSWEWVLECQHREIHPYTQAAPGGWGWTDLSGGVPDADDTPGALLALAHCRADSLSSPAASRNGAVKDGPAPDGAKSNESKKPPDLDRVSDAAGWGLRWLLDLQNGDGGWPTFCRGWGALPFDRSGTDLTAHALRAVAAWIGRLRPEGVLSPAAAKRFEKFDGRMQQAVQRGFSYLARTQRPNGSWIPLWFGNQDRQAEDEENPVYGTGKVLLAYRDLLKSNDPAALRGVQWLVSAQRPDGGWGAPPECTASRGSSIEETSVALAALADRLDDPAAAAAVEKGTAWLLSRIEKGEHRHASPMGFYFAKLWYYEKLYPLTFALGALGSLKQTIGGRQPSPKKPAEHAVSNSTPASAPSR